MNETLIDGRVLQDHSAVRGIGTYVRGLLRGYTEMGVIEGMALLTRRGFPPPPEAVDLPCKVVSTTIPVTPRRLQPLLDPFLVRRAVATVRPRLYHAVEYAQPLWSPVPVVVTVHDLIPFVLPHLYPWMRRERLVALRQLRHASAVIAVSASTAADLQRLAHVDPSCITVVHLGVTAQPALAVAERERVRSRLALPRRFLLAVGTFDPRKRLDALLKAVRAARGHHDVGLVIAGEQGVYTEPVNRAVIDAGLENVSRILGYVKQDELNALYQLCECLVFTSAYEGFGLPPLEAMSAGAPVVMFANSSLPEVGGDAALMVRDGDVADMVNAIDTLLADERVRSDRAASGRAWTRAFTWRRTAEQTLAVYERASALRRRTATS